MRPLEVTLRPARVYVFGHRIHHGLVGLILLLHDRNDWKVWVKDLVMHPVWRDTSKF